MSQMKKFLITCNEGSLSGSGKMQQDIKLVEWALSEDEARHQFNACRTNKVYGRIIKKVEEARS